MTDSTRPIGFRRTQSFMGNPKGIGWRFWIGPLLIHRMHGTGICASWTRRSA